MRPSWSIVALPVACMLLSGAAAVLPTEASAKKFRIVIVPKTSGTKDNNDKADLTMVRPKDPAQLQADHAASMERAKRTLEAEKAAAGATTNTIGTQVTTAGTLTCIAGCYGKR
jgi:hypothetical protein